MYIHISESCSLIYHSWHAQLLGEVCGTGDSILRELKYIIPGLTSIITDRIASSYVHMTQVRRLMQMHNARLLMNWMLRRKFNARNCKFPAIKNLSSGVEGSFPPPSSTQIPMPYHIYNVRVCLMQKWLPKCFCCPRFGCYVYLHIWFAAEPVLLLQPDLASTFNSFCVFATHVIHFWEQLKMNLISVARTIKLKHMQIGDTPPSYDLRKFK